ncbi:TonB-dependent receptor [Bacteroides gallinaceum]|uniref:TonB-dependent receptor n=3 Tax=Bacteroidaceae TaxID=815 RepID=A0ABT7XBK2_9BACE|nr:MULTISPECIES: TonB-dependent receptor [Bacteroides]OUO56063.1 SusC/RagA family protein [Bacteroides sp. An279]MBM6659600.1 TonB-dependent receptor [Bacteroides gallinaceum]MBM6720853.1 TonB-dependent receptor [Bacteroides gallinaceum]MBM6945268.1 TonB-dependent receptor [Bacteroides gallinaceum]MDN0051243.1 TonB-dependent receptor [Bacteroides gallinaceum]
MSRSLTLLCMLLFCIATYAQRITVSGKVTAGGEGLPGVTVAVKGSTNGTITSMDGDYSLQTEPQNTLVFSFIGYETQEVPINGQKTINIEMHESSIAIDEVVIAVPYGTAKKSTFTGSASVIDKKIIAASQVSSVSKALQGTVAGLQSFSTSGQPGEDASIYIRGVGSANATTTPLYVVDGVPYDGALSSISSQDIASVTVLKDAAAASLYGSRAANGVIMITTKQGQNGSAPTIQLSAKYGFSSRAVRDYDQLSTNDYFMLQWEALRNSYMDNGQSAESAAQTASSILATTATGGLGINPYGTQYPQPVGTDGKIVAGATPLWDDSWEDALSQDAHYTDISASISGGSERTKYYFSLGYLNDQGAYICSGFKRYNLRTNITTDLRKWLQVGLNVSATHSVQDYPKQDDTAIGNIVLAARSIPSFYPVYERDLTTGEYLLDENGNRIYDYGNYRKGSYNGYNFAQSMLYDKKEYKRDAASIRGYLQITPLEGLSYKMSLNIDYNSRFAHFYDNPTYGKEPLTGGVEKENVRTTGLTYNNVINWNHTFNENHDVRLMAGQEYYEYNTSNFGGSRTGVITDGYYEPDVASTLSSFYGNSDQYKLLSFFGSAEYSYQSKYFVSASVRTDGSSRFHPDHRWGTFWSFGGSWKISREKFLEEAANDWLTNLTLRASYGAQGNDNVGYYAYKALYEIGSSFGESTLHASRLETPELSWETNLNLNVGLDFGFWSNRLNGTIEFFQRASKDLLFARDLVPSGGFSSIDANIGKLKNYGWEFTINGTPVLTKDWTWKLSVNATTYKNEIVELPTDVMWQSTKKWVKGGSLYDFWLYEWAGVNPENGNPQWYYTDTDGSRKITEDYSSLTSDDKVKVGSSLPKVSGGFQSDLTWRDLSLSMLFSYAIGGKLYNNDYKSMISVSGGNGSTLSKDMLNRWTPENRYTDIPRLSYDQTSYFTSSSSRWLVNRSFLRLKTVTLSYNLPEKWLHYATIKQASIFLQGENLLTFCHQQGLDPEQPINGMVSYRYPAMKTFSFGINVTL